MTMSNAALLRGGWAGLLAAALFVTSTVIVQVAPVQTPYVATTDYLHQAVLVLAFQGVVGAVIGLTVLLRRTGRLVALTMVGAVLAGTGYFVVGLLSLANLVQGERVLVGVRQIAALSLLVGSALLGVLVLITRVLPWWCGVLLIVAFPLGDVADSLFRGGEGILLALLWGSVGIALLSRAGADQAAARPTARSRSAVT
jgi:hypothetical protein